MWRDVTMVPFVWHTHRQRGSSPGYANIHVKWWCRLTPKLALFSSAPQSLEVTVVTLYSTSRLDRLEGLCTSWRGPLSGAVYQGVCRESVIDTVLESKVAVQELFERYDMGLRNCSM